MQCIPASIKFKNAPAIKAGASDANLFCHYTIIILASG